MLLKVYIYKMEHEYYDLNKNMSVKIHNTQASNISVLTQLIMSFV